MRALLYVLALVSVVLVPARAGANDSYLGKWKYGDCVLHLKGKDLFGKYAAETTFCHSGQLASVIRWRPTNNGVELLNIIGRPVASLTFSNGELVSASNGGQRVAFRRTTPAPASPSSPGQGTGSSSRDRIAVFAPHPFVAGQSCVRRGAGENCASAYDLGLPQHLPRNSTAYTKPVNVPVFTVLNFRAKIGYDQAVHFQIPAGTCVPIWACFDTQNTGPWCVTRLNGKQGYVAKFTRRQNGRDVQVNFGNGCSLAGG